MDDHIILRTIVRMLFPFIFMFGLYIQFHGEFSPGGGFQAGVICAAAFIAHGLINGLDGVLRILPEWLVRAGACLGVLVYAAVGVVALAMGGRFLEYSVLLSDPVHGQQLGIILIELGVGITVFSVMMIVFYMFALREK